MPVTTIMKPSTPVSTVSSLDTNTTATAVQSGPYTKAQFQNTMEGSRSVKNAKEVEQLLRDYPAALELFRTGRYKVKVKYEADVERVILVEKRSSKTTSNNEIKTNGVQQNNQSHLDISTKSEKIKEDIKTERDSERSRSRTHSRDHVASITSATDNNTLAQATTSSMRMASNIQPKVDHYRTSSQDQEVSITSQSRKQHQQNTHHRTNSRDSPFNVAHIKHKGKKSSRDHPRALVPYVFNGNQPQYMWPQSRPVQHYYSNPVIPQQAQPSNNYMQPTFLPQQNPLYQQPYYYGQPPLPALGYQKPSVYPPTSIGKSARNSGNATIHSTRNHPLSSKTKSDPNRGATLPTSFHTFYPNQQQYHSTQPIYQPQIPMQMPAAWSTATHRRAGPIVNNDDNNNDNVTIENRRNSKHRAHSVETGPRGQPPNNYHNQPQQPPPPTTIENQHHYYHHHHHHHRSHPTNVPVNNTIVPTVEPVREQNIPLKETTTIINNGNSGDRLTIRQLNEIFLRTDPSGRLPYHVLPSILQRFGISLTENDLTSAARDLQYNTNEPISARRLVHVLIKLGKIAKSTHQQNQQQQQQQQHHHHQYPQSALSPAMLPEDREVTDIMTHSRLAGATSTHIHSSTHPNHWY
ncbi:unnamed protein product [Rotaria sp. Silwood1]|nr:unnamed protein product [Rotaria sp. Silwood1]CAF0840256.1 unnamed protein product [Rotaria sp. Silwood1]CAF3364147.1 unnamed protein product [Rotaria sp. Silwood1]CAF4729009.1 unnamed protein product [Rotaria sp. Silwood1]CAF4848337.1 unnamed protein product [Rotaria sp. Silwood1]